MPYDPSLDRPDLIPLLLGERRGSDELHLMGVVGPPVLLQHRAHQNTQLRLGREARVSRCRQRGLELDQVSMDDGEDQLVFARVVVVEQGLGDLAVTGDLRIEALSMPCSASTAAALIRMLCCFSSKSLARVRAISSFSSCAERMM